MSLLIGINPYVAEAARMAGHKRQPLPVPFPGMGQQVRFLTEMARIIPGFLGRPSHLDERSAPLATSQRSGRYSRLHHQPR